MNLAPPPLPTRFPCWVRAVYSWGGESKRDLGFIEGDLIECLNAGDGSWWTGRLWRDRRAVGAFPSNFVELLPDTFRPMTRSTSPMPATGTPSPNSTPKKSKTFRKPFEAYAKAPHYTTAKTPETYKDGSVRSRQPSPNSATSREDGTAQVPTPPTVNVHGSQGRSPAVSFHYAPRYPSLNGRDSPPPPPPPPHRHVPMMPEPSYMQPAYVPEHLARPKWHAWHDRPTGHHSPPAPSPVSASPGGGDGFTPSPLREAMDDVMEQLDALGVGGRDTHSPEPVLDAWSPESFELLHRQSRRKREQARYRSQTLLAITQQMDDEPHIGSGTSLSLRRGAGRRDYHNSYDEDDQPQTQLSKDVARMESRLRNMHVRMASNGHASDARRDQAPPPPLRAERFYADRPKSSMDHRPATAHEPRLRHKKSAYEMSRQVLSRTFTTKTSSSTATRSTATNGSLATQSTDRSLMSGASASAISATSAGSLARKSQNRAQSALRMREADVNRPETPFSGPSYHSSHASDAQRAKLGAGLELDRLGGLVQPKAKKQNLIKRILESAKTGVASSRGPMATAGSGSLQSATSRPFGRSLPGGLDAVSASKTSMQTGLGNGAAVDWVQVRRDVNRSNSLSTHERLDRRERCLMTDYPAISPTDELVHSMEGDEGADGMPVADPANYGAIHLGMVDKSARFIAKLPPLTTAATVATTYVCRPFRSDVQRLRALFTWVSEKVCWEEDCEGPVDTRRVLQTKRACAAEYAVLVREMCAAVGLRCEVVRGYLKTPGDAPDYGGAMPRPNHWWNAVLVDNAWRFMDCCLASPSNPRRALYSSSAAASADTWWFLARPAEICWTHVPELPSQQHICPPVAHAILLALPCACPPFFRHGLQMVGFNTSLTRIEDLEMVHVQFSVPVDVEVAAEVEVRAYTRDSDGDLFESGDVVRKRALSQADWFGGFKRYTVKALLPGDEGAGILKVYAGKRGLMHSFKDIPHPLAFALPITHTGENPPYEFVTRHPTPHAQRHDIYVVQPQCQRLALNNTFVFAIRQHPSSADGCASNGGLADRAGAVSPIALRPGSALSMTGSSVTGSNPSSSSSGAGANVPKKPAKLAIQTPSGKILRLMRKEERRGVHGGVAVAVGVGVGPACGLDDPVSDGSTWETIIKCSEKGVWRGLVLADRTARWCVFAEWVCVG